MVFLSHTTSLAKQPSDRSFVAAALDAVVEAGHVPCDMRYFTAEDRTPAEVCVDAVRKCSVYVGLFGLDYGSEVPDHSGISYTELEFITALEEKQRRGLRIFAFLRAEEERPLAERGPRDGKQTEFLERVLKSGLTVAKFDTADGLQHEIFRALIGNASDPCVTFDRVHSEGDRADVAFTVHNRSNKLTVVSDITVSVLFVSELPAPVDLPSTSSMSRTVLKVNLTEEAVSLLSRVGRLKCEGLVSLVDMSRVIHIGAGAASSYLINFSGKTSHGTGYVCLFAIEVHTSTEAGSRSIAMPYVFEAVADPFTCRFQVAAHPMADVRPVMASLRGEMSESMGSDAVEVIRRRNFSSGFLNVIRSRIEQPERFALYLHLATTGEGQRRHCALWLSVLQDLLANAPPDSGERNRESISWLLTSSYPYRHRLLAARLLATSSSLSDPAFHRSPGCSSLIRFCEEILIAPRAEDYRKRTVGQVGDRGMAIETLRDIASADSVGLLVRFITQEKRDVASLKKGVEEVEWLAGKDFRKGYRWAIAWGGRSIWLLLPSCLLGILLAAQAVRRAGLWASALFIPAAILGLVVGMLGGTLLAVFLGHAKESIALQRTARRIGDWYKPGWTPDRDSSDASGPQSAP